MEKIYVRGSMSSDFSEITSLLEQLTTVGEITQDKISDNIYSNIYVAYTIVNGEEIIVGCSTLLIEDKIIHRGGKVGHIEDVVVNQKYRVKGIRKLLIDHCVEIAKREGCYKVILDCDEDNVRFYEKCGFKPHGVCMRIDM